MAIWVKMHLRLSYPFYQDNNLQNIKCVVKSTLSIRSILVTFAHYKKKKKKDFTTNIIIQTWRNLVIGECVCVWGGGGGGGEKAPSSVP